MAIFLKLCNKWPEGTNHIPKRAGGNPKPKELHELIGKVRCFARALPSDKVPWDPEKGLGVEDSHIFFGDLGEMKKSAG